MGGGSCLQAVCLAGWRGQDGLAAQQFSRAGAPLPTQPGSIRFWWNDGNLFAFCRRQNGVLVAKSAACPSVEDGTSLARAANELDGTTLRNTFGCAPCQ